MKNNKKISVIVPIYNVRDYLEEALNSLKKQTFKNFEVIMVNDCSTDDSISIARKFLEDERFLLINRKKNGGLSKARNTGIKYAKGEWIYFFDSDDILPCNLFELLVKNMSIITKLDLIWFNYTDLSQIKNINKPINIKSQKILSKNQTYKLLIENQLPTAPWSYIFKKKILNKNSKIRFPDGKFFEDITFNPLLISQIRYMLLIKFNPGGYFYRSKRVGSITNSLSEEKICKQISDWSELDTQKYKILLQEYDEADKVIQEWYVKELIRLYFDYLLILVQENKIYIYKTKKFIFDKIKLNIDSVLIGRHINLSLTEKLKLRMMNNPVLISFYFKILKLKYRKNEK